jgi:penicillin-binding protein A
MKNHPSESWRSFQSGLQRRAAAGRFWRRFLLRTAAGALLVLAVILGFRAFSGSAGDLLRTMVTFASALARPAAEPIDKADVRQLLDEKAFLNLTSSAIDLTLEGEVLQVETTLDVDLQSYLLGKLDRRHSRYIGIVAMDGETGRVLAMTGFDRTDPDGNPCLASHFPAASIFKMVTAACAVDQCGYTADSSVYFNGSKHTLYKRQLTDAVDRYTTTVSFREAFADSVNPVFGKLGKLHLGKPVLAKSAAAFGFNEPLDFELPLPPSRFQISDESYHWAEVASGFNRGTTLSPLHGAVMASAVLNDGRMVAPSIVERIVDAQGKELYRWQPAGEEQAMSAGAATVLGELMETTITSGTGRKSFRNYQRDKVLSRLQIGGKTGSISDRAGDVRYDWFVGYARERSGQRQLVLGIIVGHEEYIGTRAADYARMAITRYFGNISGTDRGTAKL